MTEVEIFKQSLDVSRIAMFITLAMAITSLVFSALTMAFDRSHNKKSIRPYCRVTVKREGNAILVLLLNAGLGPMILKSIRIQNSHSLENVFSIESYPAEELVLPSEEILIQRLNKEVVSMDQLNLRIAYNDVYAQEYVFEVNLGKMEKLRSMYYGNIKG